MLSLRKQSGTSMMGVIAAMGLAGVFAASIGTGMKVLQKQDDISKNLPIMTRYASQLLRGGRDLLLDTEDAVGKKTQGVCSLVSTNAVAAGVGNIHINLFPTGSQWASDPSKYPRPFSNARWDRMTHGWNYTNRATSKLGCNSPNNWRKCFRPDPELNRINLSPQKFKSLNLVGVIDVKPIFSSPSTQEILREIKPMPRDKALRMDVKAIGFEVNASVYYNRFSKGKSKRFVKKLSNYIWAPSAGVCDAVLKATKRPVKLSLSGTGASNVWGNTIYNRAGYGAPSKADPISVTFLKTQAQKGKLTEDGQLIATDTQLNIAASCNETRYRCPAVKPNRRNYGAMNLFVDLDYTPINAVSTATDPRGFAARMNMKPDLVIKRPNGTNIVPKGSKSLYFMAGKTSDNGKYSVSGHHTFQIKIRDAKNADYANSVCRQVCTGNSYNDLAINDSKAYHAALTMKFDEAQGRTFGADTKTLMGCTACYMKSCAQLGLGTFGPMKYQPYQPLDSSIPECWATENKAVVNNEPYKKAAQFSFDTSGSGDCIVGSMVKGSNKISLRRSECSGTSKAVMCYNFGRFLLARRMTAGSWSLDKVSDVEDAANTCMKMGREVVPQSNLNTIVQGGTQGLPTNGTNYDFVNLAQQGMFLAPQIADDIMYYRQWSTQMGINYNEEFWVALDYSTGELLARRPDLPTELPNHEHAVYANDKGEIVVSRIDHEPFSGSEAFAAGGDEDAEKTYLLFHSVKYKGVAQAANSQSRQLAFLCRDDGKKTYVVSKGKSSSGLAAEGDGICAAEGYTYDPPLFPMDWITALMETESLPADMSFPDPEKINSNKDLDPVWVRHE